MATHVARPGHRRQGSDPSLPPVGTTATVTLDGRLLENPELQQRGRQQKEEDSRAPAKARPPPLAARPQPQHNKAPMTPPRVSGVSLAPLLNLDISSSGGGGGSNGGAAGSGGNGAVTDRTTGPGGPVSQQPQQPHGGRLLQRRPSVVHVALGGKAPPPPAAVVLPPAVTGGGVGGGLSPGGGGPQAPTTLPCLIAEGRGIQRTTATGMVETNPFLAAYLDINGPDTDSICATPPRISMQALTRGDGAGGGGGAFGPLTPCPLSPSILTLCGQPGLDDQFVFNSSSDLVDMRTCQSPKLPALC